jgi:hypothetical protein
MECRLGERSLVDCGNRVPETLRLKVARLSPPSKSGGTSNDADEPKTGVHPYFDVVKYLTARFGGATQDAPASGDAPHSIDTSADIELQLEARRSLIKSLYQFEVMLETCVKFARPVQLMEPPHPPMSSDPIESKPDPLPLSPNPTYQGPHATAASPTPTAVAGDIEMTQLLPHRPYAAHATSSEISVPRDSYSTSSHVEEEKKQVDREPTKSASTVGIPVLPAFPIMPFEGVIQIINDASVCQSLEDCCRNAFPLANTRLLSDILCASLKPSSLTDEKLNDLRQMLGLKEPAQETVATETVPTTISNAHVNVLSAFAIQLMTVISHSDLVWHGENRLGSSTMLCVVFVLCYHRHISQPTPTCT